MAINHVELDRKHELAEFLRSRRARVSPEQVGLPRGTRRRTPGLRRGEVALLAGMSPEWYTRLEQGLDIHVSVQLLESLSKVLKMDAKERTHLFLLALRQPPPIEGFTPPSISPTLQQFLRQLGTTPACVIDPRLNIVTWNAAYQVTFCGILGDPMSERDQNVIWRLFTSPLLHRDNQTWLEMAQLCLAHFRAEYGRFVDDPWWAEQIAELNRISPEFRELWSRHDVLSVTEKRKSMQHPFVGELCFDLLWLQPVDSSDLRITLYSPRSNSGTAEKIERLLALESEQNMLTDVTA